MTDGSAALEVVAAYEKETQEPVYCGMVTDDCAAPEVEETEGPVCCEMVTDGLAAQKVVGGPQKAEEIDGLAYCAMVTDGPQGGVSLGW